MIRDPRFLTDPQKVAIPVKTGVLDAEFRFPAPVADSSSRDAESGIRRNDAWVLADMIFY